MNRIHHLFLFCCLSISFNLFAVFNVIYLMPSEENIYELPKPKYNVFYIVNKNNFTDSLERKIASGDGVCRVKSDGDIKDMIFCMEQFAVKFKEERSFDFLIDNGTELGVDMASQLRSKFGVKFGLTAEKAKFFLDKKDMKQRLVEKNSSVKTAPFVTFPSRTSQTEFKNTILAKLHFPIMIKQLDGHASIGVYHVDNAEKLEQIVDELQYHPEAYIAEEFIPGRVLRIDGHSIAGKIEALYYSYYEPSCYDFYNYGQPQITYSDKTRDISSIKDFTAKILDAFEYSQGMFHLEAIEHGETKELYFLEIAARPGADSEFLKKLFNYNYSYLYWQLQLGFNVKDSEHKTMQESDEYAVVDCPTLPYKDGEWAFQSIAKRPSYTTPKACKIFMMNVPNANQRYKLEPAPVTFMTAGFKGKNAYQHATTFMNSITTSFYVADQPNVNGKLVKWPLMPEKGIVKKLEQSFEDSDDSEQTLEEVVKEPENSHKRKREDYAAPLLKDMPAWKKHLMGIPMSQQELQQQLPNLKDKQTADKSEEKKDKYSLPESPEERERKLVRTIEFELKKGNGISAMYKSRAITSKSTAERLINKYPHLRDLDKVRRTQCGTPRKRQKLTKS